MKYLYILLAFSLSANIYMAYASVKMKNNTIEISKNMKQIDQNLNTIIKEAERQKVFMFLNGRINGLLAAQKMGFYYSYDYLKDAMDEALLEYAKPLFTQDQLNEILNYQIELPR